MSVSTHTPTPTHTQPFYSSLDFVRDNPGELVPEETFHQLTAVMVISHPLSASSIYYDPWHPPCSIYVPDSLFPQSPSFLWLPLGLAPSTSYSTHFFTQSLSSFCSTWPYHHNLFCCSTEIMSSNASLSLNPLLGTLSCSFMPHIHLTILISAHWYAPHFPFLLARSHFHATAVQSPSHCQWYILIGKRWVSCIWIFCLYLSQFAKLFTVMFISVI